MFTSVPSTKPIKSLRYNVWLTISRSKQTDKEINRENNRDYTAGVLYDTLFGTSKTLRSELPKSRK